MLAIIRTFVIVAALALACKGRSHHYNRYASPNCYGSATGKVIYGKVKEVTEYGYGLEKKFGALEKVREVYVTYLFDASGKVVKTFRSDDQDTTYISYNESGRILEQRWVADPSGSIENNFNSNFTTYRYLDDFTKRQNIYAHEITMSTLNAAGDQVEQTIYSDNGKEEVSKYTFKYDLNGNVVYETFQTQGFGDEWTQRKYDASQNETEEIRSSGQIFSTFYEGFDRYNNWLKAISINVDPYYVIERQIKYYNE